MIFRIKNHARVLYLLRSRCNHTNGSRIAYGCLCNCKWKCWLYIFIPQRFRGLWMQLYFLLVMINLLMTLLWIWNLLFWLIYMVMSLLGHSKSSLKKSWVMYLNLGCNPNLGMVANYMSRLGRMGTVIGWNGWMRRTSRSKGNYSIRVNDICLGLRMMRMILLLLQGGIWRRRDVWCSVTY